MLAPKPLVLVVDDTDELRELFVEVIEALGFPVASACNGAQAIRMLPAVLPAVVLLDMNMPELDGLGFLERLRGMAGPAPLVIAMSADGKYSALCKGLGAFDFLQKPMDASVLGAALAEASRGRAISAADRARHCEHIREKYAADDARRDALLDHSGIDAADVHHEVAAMLRWLSGYFGMPIAAVVLVRHGRPVLFEVHGVSGISPGTPVPDPFSEELTRNSESILVRDASSHPLYCEHAGVKGTFRAYVATPIRTLEGISVGTVLLKSHQPIDASTFRAEDLILLRYFADAFGRCAQQSPPASRSFSDATFIDPAAFRAVVASRVAPSCPDAFPFSVIELVGANPDFVAEVRRVVDGLDSRQRLAVARQDTRDSTIACLGSAEQLAAIANELGARRQSFSMRAQRIARHSNVESVEALR
jgi:CheY-like chemotaxis protein